MIRSTFVSRAAHALGGKHILETEVVCASDRTERSRIASEIIACLSNRHYGISSGTSQKLAIEVDGPSHFYVHSTRYTAYSKLKHRILSNLGYRVVHIPYFEWNKLSSVEEKELFVLGKLNSPGDISDS